MHSSRALILGFSLGLSLSLITSCGPSSEPCSPSSCSGCCDENGDCVAGSGLLACGAGGEACVSCPANQACLSGACGLIDGGDYDASFPDRPDASINYDAGVYDAGPMIDAGLDAGADAGRPDAGPPDAGPIDAGAPDAGVDAGPPDAGADAGVSDAGVSFAADIQPIFNTICIACHTWSHSSTVNVMTTCGGAGSVYIKPFDLDASRMYGKISGNPACGAPMPFGLPPLSTVQVEAMAAWILAGAPNN